MTEAEEQELFVAVSVALKRVECIRTALQHAVIPEGIRETINSGFLESSEGKPLRDDPSVGLFRQHLEDELRRAIHERDGLAGQFQTRPADPAALTERLRTVEQDIAAIQEKIQELNR